MKPRKVICIACKRMHRRGVVCKKAIDPALAERRKLERYADRLGAWLDARQSVRVC